MRCFIGIPVIGTLAHQCVTLSHSMGHATPMANLHLTLAFLGEQSEAALNQLHGPLKELADNSPPFQQLLNRCEPFPREQGPFMALTGAACLALSSCTMTFACVFKSTVSRGRGGRFGPTLRWPNRGLRKRLSRPLATGCYL